MTELTRLISEYSESDSSTNTQPTEVKQEEATPPTPLPASEPGFYITFKSDMSGDLNVGIAWPKGVQPSQIAQVMSTMLHQISSGAWKSPMVGAVQNCGLDNNQMDISQAILELWSGMVTEERGGSLCVDPTQVFKGQSE